MKKKLVLALIGILMLLFGNGCYYVFSGQNRSAEKLRQGKDLNLYEMFSIYTMHVALWSLGWPMSPQAARECFMLHFPQNDTVSLKMNLSSPRMKAAVQSLKDRAIGSSVKLVWNGDEAYSLKNAEHKTAIAVNPCQIVKDWQEGDLYTCSVYSLMQYPKQSNTVITVGLFRIHIQEGLFRYLQDKGWLSCFVARYHIEIITESAAITNRFF